jgi:hypothetical protein
MALARPFFMTEGEFAASQLGQQADDVRMAFPGVDALGQFVAPHSPEGIPACSAVGDPSGNWVWLYQG